MFISQTSFTYFLQMATHMRDSSSEPIQGICNQCNQRLSVLAVLFLSPHKEPMDRPIAAIGVPANYIILLKIFNFKRGSIKKLVGKSLNNIL